ncbi:MAG TPA: hypothetical protein VK697_08980 [Methylomirabilota bacterium]|nr:hypothetical protein [Methylomirabilota bacterium]
MDLKLVQPLSAKLDRPARLACEVCLSCCPLQEISQAHPRLNLGLRHPVPKLHCPLEVMKGFPMRRSPGRQVTRINRRSQRVVEFPRLVPVVSEEGRQVELVDRLIGSALQRLSDDCVQAPALTWQRVLVDRFLEERVSKAIALAGVSWLHDVCPHDAAECVRALVLR